MPNGLKMMAMGTSGAQNSLFHVMTQSSQRENKFCQRKQHLPLKMRVLKAAMQKQVKVKVERKQTKITAVEDYYRMRKTRVKALNRQQMKKLERIYNKKRRSQKKLKRKRSSYALTA